MKKVTPIGYGKSSIGVCFGIFFVIGAIFLSKVLINSGASPSDTKYLIIGAGILAVLMGLSDFTSNLRNAPKIKHMNEMLECPAVKGEIKEIKKVPFVMGKLHEDKDPDKYSAKNIAYKLLVEFDDVSGSRKTIVSEAYVTDPKVFVNGNNVYVHYSPEGEYWIDPVQIGDVPSPDENEVHGHVKAMRFVMRHSALVSLLSVGWCVVVLAVAYLMLIK